MSIQVSANDVLQTVARSLVVQQKYPNIDAALKEIAVGVVKQKVSQCRRRIRSLERKHKMSFDEFTKSLRGRANPLEEDDWFEWQAAQGMLDDWQKTLQELARHAVY
jgi:hypothetical protein